MRCSELDNIKGLGAARRTELVKHFGSVKQLRQASVADITAVKGFGPQLAQKVIGMRPDASMSLLSDLASEAMEPEYLTTKSPRRSHWVLIGRRADWNLLLTCSRRTELLFG